MWQGNRKTWRVKKIKDREFKGLFDSWMDYSIFLLLSNE